jgi:hypothetical protein
MQSLESPPPRRKYKFSFLLCQQISSDNSGDFFPFLCLTWNIVAHPGEDALENRAKSKGRRLRPFPENRADGKVGLNALFG